MKALTHSLKKFLPPLSLLAFFLYTLHIPNPYPPHSILRITNSLDSMFAPITSPKKHTPQYIGCYLSSFKSPDMPLVIQPGVIPDELCIQFCFRRGYKYSGVNRYCMCGNTFGRYGSREKPFQNCNWDDEKRVYTAGTFLGKMSRIFNLEKILLVDVMGDGITEDPFSAKSRPNVSRYLSSIRCFDSNGQ